jgi:2-desacetyl-2-hydroxyethyl bacteriochlorophyllide A dehydrogenase
MKGSMKAAVFLGKGRIEVREVAVPEPAEGEALLKVVAAGVCGTDAHIYTGEIQNARPPVVLGHEITGEIVAVGRSVKGFGTGDWVAADPFVYCGTCEFCREGQERFCENERFLGYTLPGGFAQYVSVPAANLYHLRKGMSVRECALVEPLATVVAGVSRLKPEPGRAILILGAGTIGLLWTLLARASAPRLLIQTELVAERRERARELGADAVIDPSSGRYTASAGAAFPPGGDRAPSGGSFKETVLGLCPRGVDCLVDATGSTAAVQEALPLLKKGGVFMSFGICPDVERLSISLNWFYKNQVSFITSRRPPKEMRRAVDLVERGFVDAGRIVTGVYRLEEIENTFTRFFNDRSREVKMAIDPWM